MKTSIIVVNWNTKAVTVECIDSILRHTQVPFELIIVDNGSHDGSGEAFAPYAQASNVQLVSLPENLGFAGGSNEGLKAATGHDCVLINSDCVVTRGWLSAMLQCKLANPDAGLIGPYTNRAKGRQRKRPRFGKFRRRFLKSASVEFLSFFCVLLTKPAREKVGELDTRFGLGTFEDDDYCRRVLSAGLSLHICGKSWVWHSAHATFKANALDEHAIKESNRDVYQEKWEDEASSSDGQLQDETR